jgi:hypothetical protein
MMRFDWAALGLQTIDFAVLVWLLQRFLYKLVQRMIDARKAGMGKCVSRVGGKTQAPVLKALSESLPLEYAQFLELEVFTRFGTMIDGRTRKDIEHGSRTLDPDHHPAAVDIRGLEAEASEARNPAA